MRFGWIGAVAVAAACSSAPAPAPELPAPEPEPPKPQIIDVAPLALPAVTGALILGTGPGGQSTVVPLPDGERTREVDAVYYQRGEPPTVGASVVRLSTAIQDMPRVRVAIHEQASGGLGDSWRASVWSAASASASLLGRELGAFRFTAEADGFVEGPGAAALFAAGFLAALTDAEVDASVTISATINPDGTLGPVSGAGEKLTAAGARKLGVAVPMKGAETVADLRAAYALLTGKTLPAPQPVEPEAMALTDAERTQLEEQYASWRTSLGLHWDTLLSIKTHGALPAPLEAVAERARHAGSEAERLLREGRPAAAYHRAVEATVYGSAATTVMKLVDKVAAGDVDAALYLFDAELKSPDRSRAALDRIAASEPTTIGGLLAAVSANRRAIAALGLELWSAKHAATARAHIQVITNASKQDQASPATAEAVVGAALPLALINSCGDADARVALDALDADGAGGDAAFASDPERLRREAVALSSAAAARMKYFETLTVEALAAQTGGSAEEVALAFAVAEPDWIVAASALFLGLPDSSPLARELRDAWGADSTAWSTYATGAGAEGAFTSSLLIARWYSLGVERDFASGATRGARHEAALALLLERAERAAREHARSAQVAVGFIPLRARRAYQTAVALSEGGLEDRLTALEQFWEASDASRLAVALARSKAAN